MKSASVADSQIHKVAAALRKTTETLARELAHPSSAPPLWTEFEWRIARAVAAMHGVSSLLWAGLGWAGPEAWRQFLVEQRHQSVARHLKIAHLLSAIDAQARRQGIPLIALKGAALLARGIYACGERPMADVDLLVRKDDAPATARLLEACGYEAAYAARRHEVFLPRIRKALTGEWLGEHADIPLKIEVHTRISEYLPVNEVDITQYLFPLVAHPGLNSYPSAASLMLHLLLHAAGNMRARAVRLIQLHDIARLAGCLEAQEWEELLAKRPEGRGLWWALAPLMLTARYHPADIPPSVLERAGVECPWQLRNRARRQQLADVSWSKIRIEAFPGVEWSRTPREALSFMRSRIWPSREALLELRDGAGQIPNASTVPWYGISHAARILRWVFSRPPRVQTLLPVRAALAQKS